MWPHLVSGSTPRVAQWLIMEWNGCKHFVYFCVCEIFKVQSHFCLILTADPDGLMVVMNTCDPHLISGSTPRVAQRLIMEWNGCKHFVYFCVCEILKVQSHFWLILTADPDGLMVVMNTCDPHLISGSTPRVAQWLIMEWNGCKHFAYFCVCEILKVQSHFWLILTADPDGLMVVMNTCDPHLIYGSTPRVAQWPIMEWNGSKHFVYFCVCEILKVQSHFWLILTADPDGLMVVINTCDPHLISGSTPRVAQWLIMEWNGCKHFVYFCVCEILKVQSHFWLILTADPDGLMVVINTCDPHLISGSTPRVAQWLIMEWNGCKHFVYFCVCEILKVQSHFWLILTADPDGLMVVMNTCDPHLVSGSTPRVAQWLIMEWNGCKHFVYFCVCEILKVQSHFWLILTADPDGLMVVMNTCDPHLISGSTPRVAQWLIMEWNGCKHFVYFCVCEILKVQSHFWLILTADPDGLMVVMNTCDPHLISGSTPRVAQWLIMEWNGCKHFAYFCVCEILKVQSHFWLILTADPDGLMVVMNTCDPHLISGSTPRVAQWLIMEWNGCKHFVYFCVCEILKVQSHFWLILTADPDGLMVVINTCDPHLISGSTPRVAQWLIMEWNGCKHFVYFCVCEILKVQSHFWLILTADPDGLMVVMNTCDPHLISGSTPRVAQWLIMEWNGCKHFVYFCVCEILKVQSHFWLILTADPDGLMVVMNTCDPHLVSGSTPRVAQWLIMEWNGCKHFVYFCVCDMLY